MAWLITGGAGFIGSNFIRLLYEKRNAKMVVVDTLTYAGDITRISNMIDDDRVTFLKADICDRQAMTAIFAEHQISKVVHFAAESHVDRSILGPGAFIRTNIEGTYSLLETAREAWTDKQEKLFLHVSTDEVYGTLKPQDPPFDETTPYRPNSPYSASKASSDLLVRSWFHTYGLPAIITNCSNNYGPWQFPEKLIPLIIMNALEGKELPVYGDGLQIRDWLHVDDHCEAILRVIEKGRIGETYCIGGNCERANITIVQQICDIVDDIIGKATGTSRGLIKYVKDRPGHDRRYAINSSKLMNELHWTPSYSFNEALPGVVRWYLDHIDWVNSVRSGEYLSFYQKQYGDR